VRLDEAPELLFTLRGVDHAELIAAAADAAVQHAQAAAQATGDTVAAADLSAVFGIDLTPAPAPVRETPGGAKRRRK
jgi:uncharacterized Zn finger protein